MKLEEILVVYLKGDDMQTGNFEIYKQKKILGNIVPVHQKRVTGIVEDFNDGRNFITVSEDRSLAVTNSETLEIVKFEAISKYPITAAEMMVVDDKKVIIVGNSKGELILINADYKKGSKKKVSSFAINHIASFSDGTFLLASSGKDGQSLVEYFDLNGFKMINKIELPLTRKIKSLRVVPWVKDKCVVASSFSNVYWFKVVDGKLKLLIDEPSPDNYYYDDIWSDGKVIIKAGEPCFLKNHTPLHIKHHLLDEERDSLGNFAVMDVLGGAIARAYKGQLELTGIDGLSLNKIPLPKDSYASKLKIYPKGRIIIGFSTGEVARFDFRSSNALRFIMD